MTTALFLCCIIFAVMMDPKVWTHQKQRPCKPDTGKNKDANKIQLQSKLFQKTDIT